MLNERTSDGSDTNNSSLKNLICSCVQLESPDILFTFWVMQFTEGNQPYSQHPSEKTGGFDFGGRPFRIEERKRTSYVRTLLRIQNNE
jgi:hypothetical protein